MSLLTPLETGARTRAVPFYDYFPPEDDIERETREGLTATPKRLPAKFLYDWTGSRLFDRICDLEEYYPTRTELTLFREHAGEIAMALGPDITLVEYGSGGNRKIERLLDATDAIRRYVAIDISREFLRRSVQALAAARPELEVAGICADYTQVFELPPGLTDGGRRVVFFPGSTIGNLYPAEAETLLRQMGALVGSGGGILIGVDLKKDRRILESAYNDACGLTARFNLNILTHLNRRLGCHFETAHFRHRAFYNESAGRIEMHLDSLCRHRVWLGELPIEFEPGESIHTENSYKYALDEFRALATRSGLQAVRAWVDDKEWFSVHYLRRP